MSAHKYYVDRTEFLIETSYADTQFTILVNSGNLLFSFRPSNMTDGFECPDHRCVGKVHDLILIALGWSKLPGAEIERRVKEHHQDFQALSDAISTLKARAISAWERGDDSKDMSREEVQSHVDTCLELHRSNPGTEDTHRMCEEAASIPKEDFESQVLPHLSNRTQEFYRGREPGAWKPGVAT